MATRVRSQGELYDLYVSETKSVAPNLTDFSEGSINDILAGVTSFAVSEAQKLIIDEFKKTFFQTSDGPELTGGIDEIEVLAVDHFGDSFARPGDQTADGIAKFERPNADAGEVIIPVGTIVKTDLDANGETQKFETILEVVMGAVALNVNSTVEALVAGPKGNIEASELTTVESSLTDATITVTNDDAFSGGDPELNDEEYREFIINKIQELAGATKAALRAKALTIPGVEQVTIIEDQQIVREWDQQAQEATGPVFRIPRVRVFIADANGTANAALIEQVEDALFLVRACGVKVGVFGSTALLLNWTATIELNPGGPNFGEFQSDTTQIEDSMADFLRDLDVGADFIIDEADQAILDIWGPSGTDDLVTFVTDVPVGNVITTEVQKIVPDVMAIS